jgi:chromosome segregation ATPase
MVEELREVLQALLVPQLEALRGEIQALDMKVESTRRELISEIHGVEGLLRREIGALAGEIGTLRGELGAVAGKVSGLDSEMRRVEHVLSSQFARRDEKVDVRLSSMNEKIDTFRRELLAEIKAATAVR